MEEEQNNTTQTQEEIRGLKGLLERHKGDALALASDLLTENASYRAKNRELRKELEEAKSKAIPDGALMLSAGEAESWKRYQAIGHLDAVEELARLGPLPELATQFKEMKGRLVQLEKEQLVARAANEHGYKPHVLAKLVGDQPLTEKDGQILVGEKPIAKWVEEDQSDFLPSLTVAGEQLPVGPGEREAQDPLVNLIEQFQKERDNRPNPLNRK